MVQNETSIVVQKSEKYIDEYTLPAYDCVMIILKLYIYVFTYT